MTSAQVKMSGANYLEEVYLIAVKFRNLTFSEILFPREQNSCSRLGFHGYCAVKWFLVSDFKF